jgi:hypothetical protein
MRIAHIADVHLGYRAYSRVTSRGLNQRGARPVELEWKDFAGTLQDLPAGVDRERLVELGLRYLEEAAAEEQEVPL